MITINGLHRQLVYDVERYNDTMNNDNDGNPVIGPRDWKQQKLLRGAEMFTSCLTDYDFCNIYYTKKVAVNLNNENYS